MTVFLPCKEHKNSRRPRDRDRIPSRNEEPIVKHCSRCTQRGHFRNKCPEPMPAPSSLLGSSSRCNRSQSRTTYENENQQEDVFGTYNLEIFKQIYHLITKSADMIPLQCVVTS
ncbi:hypothetical protein OSB04_011506 [Centaurea solstitialis]|uniref:CCHC-type domain-containing protein n=1 Tax=Centaurea solstitialis TaxID=347529 RepID=A0AA38WDR3_9ASTR|nr:hypothetical protein OSB04_011506 [Centaurea solstitialis]